MKTQDLTKLSDQQLRDLLRRYNAKVTLELPCNDPSWPHVLGMLNRIDAEFNRRIEQLRQS